VATRWATALRFSAGVTSSFSSRVLQGDVVEHGIGQHRLQFGVLVFQRPQARGLVRRAIDPLADG